MSALHTFLTVSIGGGSDFFGGPFHTQCKKIEKTKNDLDLFYVYFSSVLSYKYPFIEKNCPKLTKKKFIDVFTRSLDSEHSGWDRYV